MEYTVSKAKRNILIACSVFLILHVLVYKLLYIDFQEKYYTFEIIIRSITYLIPFGYLMWIFYNYLRHYNLKVLQYSIVIIFMLEVFTRSTFLGNAFESTWKVIVMGITSMIWITASITLIVVLSKNKYKNYSGILSIRNFAISILIIFLLPMSLSFYIDPENMKTTSLIIGLINVIPYIFTIVFATSLKLKESKTSS